MTNSEILIRAKEVASKPIRLPNTEKLNLVYSQFHKKTKRSNSLFAKAQTVLPNGSQHTLPLSEPYPLFMQKGKGSMITDVDENKYSDFILSGGAIILGHNNQVLNNTIIELIQSKTHFHGFFDEYEIKAAEEIISFFPSIEKVRFTSSGTEANLAAAKISRAFTGKKKIIKFLGNYHGWGNEFLIDIEVPGTGKFMSNGIPAEFLNETFLVPQNNLEELENAFRICKSNGGVAAVICEPFGADSGLIPFEEDFHKHAIKIAHSYGALYIFDEVVTGFRIGLGGAQQMLGVTPDLTTLGKAMMNGYPSCGAVGGKSEIMETASTSIPYKMPYTFIAGTLTGNVLSMAACYHVVSALKNTSALDNAKKATEKIVKNLNELFISKKANFFAYNFGSILRVELTAPHAVQIKSDDSLLEVLQRRGVISKYSLVILNNGILSRMGRDFLSASHSDVDSDLYIKAYEILLDTIN